jgi:hypothetical protein
VPEREEQPPDATYSSPRHSLRVQAQLAQLGATLGFTLWVPPSDRRRVLELLPSTYHSKFVSKLSLNYDTTTLKTIKNIDVLWLDRRNSARLRGYLTPALVVFSPRPSNNSRHVRILDRIPRIEPHSSLIGGATTSNALSLKRRQSGHL